MTDFWRDSDGGYPADYPYDDDYNGLPYGGDPSLEDEDPRDYDEEAYNRQLMEDPDGS